MSRSAFGLQFVLPTLPDPYAANVDIPIKRVIDVGTVGSMLASVRWTSGNAPVLGFDLPKNAMAVTTPLQSSAAISQPTLAGAAIVQQPPGIVLLDLSTNVDQFGVNFVASSPDAASQGSVSPLAVDSLYLESTSSVVSVLTVPAVQWEPVSTDSGPPFPSPMTFPNSGPPTTMTVRSVQLVPVAPAPALDNLVANFTTSTTPQVTLRPLDAAVRHPRIPHAPRAGREYPRVAPPSNTTARIFRPNPCTAATR